jgi:lambda family phage minor tail protein L
MTVVIREESQKPETSELIELFTLDLTVFGDTVYYFIAAKPSSGSVVWQGNTYVPFDLEAEGFELDGKGAAAQPKVRFSVTNPVITAFINAFNDMVGATITRCKTYKKFLDGETTANPNAYFPLEIYKIDRKSSENRMQVEFELASILDQRQAQLPGRTITAFYCPWLYRRWNGTAFVYAPGDNACPYTDTPSFDINNASTTSANDKCAKTESACKVRFGANAELPFGGFPGAARPILS